MSAITRNCLEPGCRCTVTRPHLMCVGHWQALPKEARQEVQIRLRGWGSPEAAIEFLSTYLRGRKAAAQ
jgi:hypothetical protein